MLLQSASTIPADQNLEVFRPLQRGSGVEINRGDLYVEQRITFCRRIVWPERAALYELSGIARVDLLAWSLVDSHVFSASGIARDPI